MADDRVMIRCDYCGGWKMLLKHTQGLGPTMRDNGIEEWIESHKNCGGQADLLTLRSVGFSLHLEDEIGMALDPGKQNQYGGKENNQKNDLMSTSWDAWQECDRRWRRTMTALINGVDSDMDIEKKGFLRGIAYMTGLVGSLHFSVAESDLFEHGYTLDDFKDAGVDPYDLKLIGRAYGAGLRKYRRKKTGQKP